jgi:hypothetical protein
MAIDSFGKRLLMGREAGLYSVLVTSEEHITPIIVEAKMMTLEDCGVARDRYYHMVTEEQYLLLGSALYHDDRPLEEQMEERCLHFDMIEQRMVSGIHREDNYN